MLCNFFLADHVGFRFFFFIFFYNFFVIVCRNTDHRFQRLDNLIVIHLFGWDQHCSHLYAARRLHDDVHRRLQIIVQRVKIINLSRTLKTDSYHFYHINSP